VLYLLARTAFQFWYLKDERQFRGMSFTDIFITSLTVVIIYYLFLTACKYFKDGYISQQFEAEKKEQQLMAEVNNLKSQIAPHFLFNTLNNLYGLAVEKSDKLPDLMLRLSNLLRHSLYETQKPLVYLHDEIRVLKSYIDLESIRMEKDLVLEFENEVPEQTEHQIAPLILIVFIENAFKHAKLVRSVPVNIEIETRLENDVFSLMIRNNYSGEHPASSNGIGLKNVQRRLEVLYPGKHKLNISSNGFFYTVNLLIELSRTFKKPESHGV
jgi:LytS/YehU family sensor histidine kinase